MFPHETGQAGIDHRFARWLGDVDQPQGCVMGLSDETCPIGDAPTHRGQVNAGYDFPQSADPESTLRL
jgi:hypothetical protein